MLVSDLLRYRDLIKSKLPELDLSAPFAVVENVILQISQCKDVPALDSKLTHSSNEYHRILAETKQVMENIKAILDEAKLSFAHVVKTSIFLSDMQLFAQVNEVYASYFTADFPARETVAVKTLPRNVNVEISITAVVNL